MQPPRLIALIFLYSVQVDGLLQVLITHSLCDLHIPDQIPSFIQFTFC